MEEQTINLGESEINDEEKEKKELKMKSFK